MRDAHLGRGGCDGRFATNRQNDDIRGPAKLGHDLKDDHACRLGLHRVGGAGGRGDTDAVPTVQRVQRVQGGNRIVDSRFNFDQPCAKGRQRHDPFVRGSGDPDGRALQAGAGGVSGIRKPGRSGRNRCHDPRPRGQRVARRQRKRAVLGRAGRIADFVLEVQRHLRKGAASYQRGSALVKGHRRQAFGNGQKVLPGPEAVPVLRSEFVDGKQIGTPCGMNAFGLIYTTEMVKAAGVEPKFATWWDLAAACPKIGAATRVACFSFPTDSPEQIGAFFFSGYPGTYVVQREQRHQGMA